MIKIRIPATSANLGAGFDSLGLAVTLYNTVYMEQAEQTDIASLDEKPVPAGKDNLIYLSAQKVYDLCGKPLSGLHIRQVNRIPMTRGLGSSSACIIAGITGANELLGRPFSPDELVNLAAEIEGHPDNTTPALLGGIVTSVFDGDKVFWVKQELPAGLYFYAIIPNFEMKTEKARSILPKQIDFSDAVYNLSRAALFSSSLLQGKYENLQIAVHDRLHQPYRLSMIPKGREVMEECYHFGAYAAYMSGAGPTIMAIVDEQKQFFGLHMRERLNEMGLQGWHLERLNIDNAGTMVYNEA